jgi:hypothetical protein
VIVHTTVAREWRGPAVAPASLALGPLPFVPAADPGQKRNRDSGERREGEHRNLPERHDDEGGEQRPGRLAEVAADLEDALGEAVPSARRRAGDARSLGVEDRAAEPDHRHGRKQQRITAGEGESDEADERERHAGRQQEIHRPPVGGEADQRLQQ